MAWSPSEKAIIKTLLYADIFRFSLTRDELWKYLISPHPITKRAFELSLKKLSSFIKLQGGYYFFKKNRDSYRRRTELEKNFEKKIAIAKYAAYYLSYVPTIVFIGVSGSVAMKNASREDDIDFFIITKSNTVFTTRLFIACILEALNLRRKKNDKNPKNKICVNLIIDEKHIRWPHAKHDVYTAHEIAQVLPLFERNHMYRDFLAANSWVKTMLPNALEKTERVLFFYGKREYLFLDFLSFLLNLFPFRRGIELGQKYIMKKSKTLEIISDHLLAFHPIDYRSNILNKLAMKEDELRSLTKE